MVEYKGLQGQQGLIHLEDLERLERFLKKYLQCLIVWLYVCVHFSDFK